MRTLIRNLKSISTIPILACCCGHGKYGMSIIAKDELAAFDLVSGYYLKRNSRFYNRDKQGYYFIPEVLERVEVKENGNI